MASDEADEATQGVALGWENSWAFGPMIFLAWAQVSLER
jgi:hypothetical protein